ncbi:hypothetical protein L2E82_38436 [Cichorium intybus]|uniref:Uncharacterized protein n=1 Tax=Cichorium intybus TaxID=13427 RepID=A0ACB9AFB6_CICIN|nr:hypothetical protein L2E82_38436 [Cichorium intybus]
MGRIMVEPITCIEKVNWSNGDGRNKKLASAPSIRSSENCKLKSPWFLQSGKDLLNFHYTLSGNKTLNSSL